MLNINVSKFFFPIPITQDEERVKKDASVTLPPPPRRNEEGKSDEIPSSQYGGIGTPIVTNQPQSTGSDSPTAGNMTKVQQMAAKINKRSPNGDHSQAQDR